MRDPIGRYLRRQNLRETRDIKAGKIEFAEGYTFVGTAEAHDVFVRWLEDNPHPHHYTDDQLHSAPHLFSD